MMRLLLAGVLMLWWTSTGEAIEIIRMCADTSPSHQAVCVYEPVYQLKESKSQSDTCSIQMEAAMREHDALDDADLALRREYGSAPEWLYDAAPPRITTCLALGGDYRCGDEFRRQLTEESIAAAERKIEEDRQLLARRQAYHAEKEAKESVLKARRTAFIAQWQQVKRDCWSK